MKIAVYDVQEMKIRHRTRNVERYPFACTWRDEDARPEFLVMPVVKEIEQRRPVDEFHHDRAGRVRQQLHDVRVLHTPTQIISVKCVSFDLKK
jgi:hypothetical protein